VRSSRDGTFAAARTLLNREVHPLTDSKKSIMLTWTLIFLVISLIAGALGFSGISGAAGTIARVLFMVFLIALAVAVILGFIHGFTWHV